jgi:hypothetical protein
MLFSGFAAVSALAVVLGTNVLSSVSGAPPATALSKIKCAQTTGTGHIDPIVNHNQKASTTQHLHQFFGNNAFLSLPNPNAANYGDLMGKATNCENAADTAGYWIPALRYKATGNLVPVRSFRAYYRSWDFQKFGDGVPLPADVRLIASKHNWSCGQFESVSPQQTIPDCSMANGTPGSTLTAHIDFPSCWDGVKPSHSAGEVGDTRDNEHFAYRVGKSCPPGFPIKTIALRETIQFSYTGKGDDLELSSDGHDGMTDGASLHGDFWNTWEPQGLASMVRNCITPGGSFSTAECG